MAGSKKKRGHGKQRLGPDQHHGNGVAKRDGVSRSVPLERRTLSELVPVRFAPDVLDEVRQRAYADDRSVSAWIRRAVDRELRRNGS
jgi:hypothetical protein